MTTGVAEVAAAAPVMETARAEQAEWVVSTAAAEMTPVVERRANGAVEFEASAAATGCQLPMETADALVATRAI